MIATDLRKKHGSCFSNVFRHVVINSSLRYGVLLTLADMSPSLESWNKAQLREAALERARARSRSRQLDGLSLLGSAAPPPGQASSGFANVADPVVVDAPWITGRIMPHHEFKEMAAILPDPHQRQPHAYYDPSSASLEPALPVRWRGNGYGKWEPPVLPSSAFPESTFRANDLSLVGDIVSATDAANQFSTMPLMQRDADATRPVQQVEPHVRPAPGLQGLVSPTETNEPPSVATTRLPISPSRRPDSTSSLSPRREGFVSTMSLLSLRSVEVRGAGLLGVNGRYRQQQREIAGQPKTFSMPGSHNVLVLLEASSTGPARWAICDARKDAGIAAFAQEPLVFYTCRASEEVPVPPEEGWQTSTWGFDPPPTLVRAAMAMKA